jgi:hypothetical protein
MPHLLWLQALVSALSSDGLFVHSSWALQIVISVLFFLLCFRCQFDYLDIYAQMLTVGAEARLSSPLLGRFCGDRIDILPKHIISTANIILIDFHSDGHRAARGFFGSFRFIDACKYIIQVVITCKWNEVLIRQKFYTGFSVLFFAGGL